MSRPCATRSAGSTATVSSPSRRTVVALALGATIGVCLVLGIVVLAVDLSRRRPRPPACSRASTTPPCPSIWARSRPRRGRLARLPGVRRARGRALSDRGLATIQVTVEADPRTDNRGPDRRRGPRRRDHDGRPGRLGDRGRGGPGAASSIAPTNGRCPPRGPQARVRGWRRLTPCVTRIPELSTDDALLRGGRLLGRRLLGRAGNTALRGLPVPRHRPLGPRHRIGDVHRLRFHGCRPHRSNTAAPRFRNCHFEYTRMWTAHSATRASSDRSSGTPASVRSPSRSRLHARLPRRDRPARRRPVGLQTAGGDRQSGPAHGDPARGRPPRPPARATSVSTTADLEGAASIPRCGRRRSSRCPHRMNQAVSYAAAPRTARRRLTEPAGTNSG